MGIKRLYKFLSERGCIKEYSNLTTYVNNIRRKQNKQEPIIIAIDFWLFAHKYSYSFGDILIGFWNQIIKLLSHKIIPLFVYDGKPPIEKDALIAARKKRRETLEDKFQAVSEEIENNQNSQNGQLEQDELQNLYDLQAQIKKSIIYINKTDTDMMKVFFDLLNVPYLSANGEADILCANLYKSNRITVCLSDDTDMLALGCGKTIKMVDGKVYECDLSYILEKLELTNEQFIEMCLLFGCDYIRPSFRLENDDAYESIKKFGSIEKIINSNTHELISNSNIKFQSFIENYQRIKQMYLHPDNSDDELMNCGKYKIIKELDTKQIFNFLQEKVKPENKKTLCYKKILTSINYINFHIASGSFT